MLPPREAAPEKVTKSFATAPCPVSDTVIVASPSATLAKVTSPALVVDLIGVISLKVRSFFYIIFPSCS
jgi:hypothetical protein